MRLTDEQLAAILQRPAVKAANPDLAGLRDPQRKPDQRRQVQDSQLETSEERVAYCVTIVSLRSRLVDAHDNLRSGAKALVDSITESLGFDNDNHPGLIWRYGQVISQTKGTVVVIERL